MQMYIDPFILGVGATLLTELVIMIIAVAVSMNKKRKGKR